MFHLLVELGPIVDPLEIGRCVPVLLDMMVTPTLAALLTPAHRVLVVPMLAARRVATERCVSVLKVILEIPS